MRTRPRRTVEELEALLDGRLSADDVGGEARRLATLATRVSQERSEAAFALTDPARERIRAQVLTGIAELEAPLAERVSAGLRPRVARATTTARAALASGLASSMIAGTGVTVAAQEAAPGDLLYGIKRGTETVRMNLANDATQAARLELRFAEERLEEISAAVDRGREDDLVAGLAEMDRRSLAGAEQLVLAAERNEAHELLAEVDLFVERQAEGLVAVFDRLPLAVRPHAEDSLATLRRIRSQLLTPALEACDCLDDVVNAGVQSRQGQAPVEQVTSQDLPPAPEEPEAEPERAARDEDASSGGEGDGDGRTERGPLEELTSRERARREGGAGEQLLEPLGESGERVGRAVDDTLEETGRTLDRTTDSVGDLLEDTTEGLDDTVEGTTEGAGELLEDTTEGLNDTVEGTTEGAGELLEDTTEGLDDTVNGLLD